MRYAEHISELVGGTPLVKLNTVTAGLSATVLVKVEYLNPGGSVKDRIARGMIDEAEASGELQPGGTIVEPTSGNTGVGLALITQQRGDKCVFVCPDKVSQDKQDVLRAYGAEVVECPTIPTTRYRTGWLKKFRGDGNPTSTITRLVQRRTMALLARRSGRILMAH